MLNTEEAWCPQFMALWQLFTPLCCPCPPRGVRVTCVPSTRLQARLLHLIGGAGAGTLGQQTGLSANGVPMPWGTPGVSSQSPQWRWGGQGGGWRSGLGTPCKETSRDPEPSTSSGEWLFLQDVPLSDPSPHSKWLFFHGTREREAFAEWACAGCRSSLLCGV